VLGVPCITDLATLAWMRAALLSQSGDVMRAAPPPLLGPSRYMDRRTVASLHQAGSL